MRKIFLDTNVLVDLIADRKPFSKHAIELFQHAENKKIHLFTSSHSIATTHYLLKKYIAEGKLREILLNLLDFVSVVPVDLDILRKALNSSHKDFEDGVQIQCASCILEIQYIVTRNGKDFKTSEIPVLAPDEMCLELATRPND